MIPVVFITDNNYIRQTGIAITSLINNKDVDTKYEITVISAGCDRQKLERLREICLEDCTIRFVEASTEKYRDIKQVAHISISALLKFDMCEILSEYDKIVYLDGDIYVRGDLTKLFSFELNGAILAGVPSPEMITEQIKMINSGVMVIDAKRMREEKLSEQLLNTRKGLGDRRSMDQQTINMVMRDNIAFLPCEYNYIPGALMGDTKRIYTLESVNELYKRNYKNKTEYEKNAVIVHYASGAKPWKYYNVSCGAEWVKCYKTSVFRRDKLNRESLAVAHIKGVGRNLKQGGIKQVFTRAADIARERVGIVKKNSDYWG